MGGLGIFAAVLMAALTLWGTQGSQDSSLRGLYSFRTDTSADSFPFYFTKVNPVGVGINELSGNGDRAEFIVLGCWFPRFYPAVPYHAKGKVLIPEYLEGLPVRKIMDKAFYQCMGITSVTLPPTIREIGEGAFSFCTALETVTIPEGVEVIGGGAFSNCFSLTSLTLPASLKRIGPRCFENCSRLRTLVFKGNAPLLDPTADPAFSYFGERRPNRNGLPYGQVLPRFTIYADPSTFGWKGPYRQGLPDKWPQDFGWMAAHDIAPLPSPPSGTVIRLTGEPRRHALAVPLSSQPL